MNSNSPSMDSNSSSMNSQSPAQAKEHPSDINHSKVVAIRGSVVKILRLQEPTLAMILSGFDIGEFKVSVVVFMIQKIVKFMAC